MKKLLTILQLIAALGPALIGFLQAIEDALPQGGFGQQKLEAVLQMVRGAFDTLKDIDVTFDEVRPVLERTIAALVALFNATGKFKKA